VSLAEKGTNVVLCGLMPKHDENGKDCSVLSKKLHMKTTPGEGIVEVETTQGQKFVSYQYGTIRSTDSKVKKIATAKGKTVGVVSSRFKGKVFFYSFDLASGGDFRKLLHLEHLLTDTKMALPVYISDPNIEVLLQKGEKSVVIFVLAPPAGELGDPTDVRVKEVLLKVDLRKVGFKGTKIKLVDQFADEEEPPLKTTVEELKNGIILNIAFPDGKIFLVEK
jgi:hypothetical protein